MWRGVCEIWLCGPTRLLCSSIFYPCLDQLDFLEMRVAAHKVEQFYRALTWITARSLKRLRSPSKLSELTVPTSGKERCFDWYQQGRGGTKSCVKYPSTVGKRAFLVTTLPIRCIGHSAGVATHRRYNVLFIIAKPPAQRSFPVQGMQPEAHE